MPVMKNIKIALETRAGWGWNDDGSLAELFEFSLLRIVSSCDVERTTHDVRDFPNRRPAFERLDTLIVSEGHRTDALISCPFSD